MNNNNVRAEVIEGISNKTGKPFKGVQFFVMTSQGEYASDLCFPSSLEMSLVEQALSPLNSYYKQEN